MPSASSARGCLRLRVTAFDSCRSDCRSMPSAHASFRRGISGLLPLRPADPGCGGITAAAREGAGLEITCGFNITSPSAAPASPVDAALLSFTSSPQLAVRRKRLSSCSPRRKRLAPSTALEALTWPGTGPAEAAALPMFTSTSAEQPRAPRNTHLEFCREQLLEDHLFPEPTPDAHRPASSKT